MIDLARRPLALAFLLLLAGALAASGAVAGSLRVTPLHLDLTPGQPPVVLTVKNEGNASTLVQVETFAWTDADVTEGLPPTDDLLAAPPVFELPPGEEQLVRLGLRRPPDGGTQKAYRLVIGEVPSMSAAGGGITFALRLNVPVFVTPPGAEPVPTWTALAFSAGRGEIVLTNHGGAHLALRDLRVTDPESRRVLLQVPDPRPVLAGGERRWRFDAGASALPPRVEVTAVSNAGDLRAVVPVEGG